MAEIPNADGAGGANQGQGRVIIPRRNRVKGMASLFRSVPVANTSMQDPPSAFQEYPTPNNTILYEPDSSEHICNVFMYCLEMIQMVGEDEEYDLLGYYASAILAVFPGQKRNIISAFSQLGILAQVVQIPSRAAEFNIVLDDGADLPSALVMAGQLILVLYKNISVAGYDGYMRRRAAALRAFSSCFFEVNVTSYLSRRKASIIRAGLGGLLNFRRDILNAVIRDSGRRDPLSNICNYLLEIIAWTDMSAMTFINDTLLITKSPVLRDPRVGHEIIRLGEAFRTICSSDHPQFYRILGEPSTFNVLNRNNFPILHSVATALRSDTNRSASQFMPVIGKDDNLVKELYEMHKASQLTIHGSRFRQNLSILDLDDEVEDEEPVG